MAYVTAALYFWLPVLSPRSRRETIGAGYPRADEWLSVAVPETLPTTVLTGFLGSGKTTLLRRALVSPALADTAVIINELGEIAIDHHLVDFVEGSVLELPGGCSVLRGARGPRAHLAQPSRARATPAKSGGFAGS